MSSFRSRPHLPQLSALPAPWDDAAMVSKHGRGRWRKSAAEGPVSLLAPLLPRRLAAALLSARCAAATLALVAAADVALALALFAELHGWRFQRGAQKQQRRG